MSFVAEHPASVTAAIHPFQVNIPAYGTLFSYFESQ
jgi:hypothetical protein